MEEETLDEAHRKLLDLAMRMRQQSFPFGKPYVYPKFYAKDEEKLTITYDKEQCEMNDNTTPEVESVEPEGPPAITDGYVHRIIAGVRDFDLLDYALKGKENVLLYGPTQSGKTSLPVAYAKANGMTCVTISGDAAMDPSELFGHRTIRDGNDGYEENHVTEVIRNGGVFVIDEINMFSQKILSPLFSLLDNRREIRIRDKGGEVVPAHEDLLIVATMNPRYAGTMALSEALLDRFTHRHEWDYDPVVEESLVPYPTLREMFKLARVSGTIDTPLSTSLMIQFAKDVKGLGWEYASANMAGRAMDSEEREVIGQLLLTHESKITREILGDVEAAHPVSEIMRKSDHDDSGNRVRFRDETPKTPVVEGNVHHLPRVAPGTVPFARAPWDN